MVRKLSGRAKLRLFAALLLFVLAGGAALWWHLRHWMPERSAYPVQGAEIGATDAPTDFATLKAIGADFVYLDASASAFARDPDFSFNLEAARAAKLQAGAVHRYDPCQPAERQAANFVTVVPRDARLLPPVVDLGDLADQCPLKVSDAAIESELTTFLNQVENHTGKPAILKISQAFEARYHIARAIDRNLWLSADRLPPGYGGRPWSLWTANSALFHEAIAQPLRWVVVRP